MTESDKGEPDFEQSVRYELAGHVCDSRPQIRCRSTSGWKPGAVKCIRGHALHGQEPGYGLAGAA
jgi:hypothetical protein